jgi:dienelactone hydrolase
MGGLASHFIGKFMLLLIATDIFGIGPHIDDMIHRILPANANCMVIDPYGAQEQNFYSEQDAYDIFNEEGGLDTYCENLTRAVIELEPDVVIGFSAGGSALYKVLAENRDVDVRALMAFYPSQIRHFDNLVLSVPSTILFPEQEPHFDVKELQKRLSSKPNVQVEQTDFAHGFMNPYSDNYSEEAEEYYITVMKQWLVQYLSHA